MTPMEHRIELEMDRANVAEIKLKEAMHEIEILKRRLNTNEHTTHIEQN